MIQDVDYSAAETLRELQQRLAGESVELVFASAGRAARKQLDRHGITAAIGESAYDDTVEAVVGAARRA